MQRSSIFWLKNSLQSRRRMFHENYFQRFFFVGTLIVCTNSLISQQTFVERIQERALKLNQTNYLSIAAEGIPCHSLIIRTYAPHERVDSCTWTVRPIKPETIEGLKIEILQVKGADTIHLDNRYFRTEKLNPLMISLGRYNGDTISHAELLKRTGIHGFEAYGQYNCLDAPATFYRFILMRGLTAISVVENKGAKFNEDILAAFALAQPGDELIFYDISFGSLDNKYRSVEMFKLWVK